MWNVKQVDIIPVSGIRLDLIETLWNVKDFLSPLYFPRTNRFNRDIVECKVIESAKRERYAGDLIETLWNVKSRFEIHSAWMSMDLIETLWNVKENKGTDRQAGRSDLIETLWNVKVPSYVPLHKETRI